MIRPVVPRLRCGGSRRTDSRPGPNSPRVRSRRRGRDVCGRLAPSSIWGIARPRMAWIISLEEGDGGPQPVSPPRSRPAPAVSAGSIFPRQPRRRLGRRRDRGFGVHRCSPPPSRRSGPQPPTRRNSSLGRLRAVASLCGGASMVAARGVGSASESGAIAVGRRATVRRSQVPRLCRSLGGGDLTGCAESPGEQRAPGRAGLDSLRGAACVGSWRRAVGRAPESGEDCGLG